jgi:hypothetical protein
MKCSQYAKVFSKENGYPYIEEADRSPKRALHHVRGVKA